MSGRRSLLSHSLMFALVVAAMLAIAGCAGPATDGTQAGSIPVNDTPSGEGQQVTDASPAGNVSANYALSELTPEAFVISEGSPYIKFLSPREDDETNGTISVAGILTGKNSTSALISVDNKTSPLAVVNGSFRTTVNISGPAEIVLSALDANGTTISSRILLDGDRLPAPYERICGFDPLNPDSDSTRTAVVESGNGTIDGFELLDGRLPAFVKWRVHAHPMAQDTDGDGLTDYFEVLKLIPFCLADRADTDRDGVPDSGEDIDQDGLTNAREQELGTDPIVDDVDRDGLPDKEEIVRGTNATRDDSDSDGLKDGFEVKVGSDPLKPDSDDDGVPDIEESHTYPFSQDQPRVDIAITGKGDILSEFRAGNETSEYYAGHPAGRGPLIRIFPNECVKSMDLTIPYPDDIVSPGNLAIVYYNDTIGMFLPVDSIVNEFNHTVSGHLDTRIARPSRWGDLMVRVFDIPALHDLNLEVAVFNAPISQYMEQSGNVVRFDVPDTVIVSDVRRGPDGRVTVTNRTLRFFPTQSEVDARL